MKTLMMNSAWLPRTLRVALLATVATVGLAQAQHAHAETMLLASTNLVEGSSADTFSFQAPTAGTITAELTTLPWPVPLNSLTFSTTTATSALTPIAPPLTLGPEALSAADMSAPQIETFQVGAGTYYTHVNAAAGGNLDLGLYSLIVTFNAVPLSPSLWMLLIGLLVMLGLMRTLRTFGPSDSVHAGSTGSPV